jgi:hypothetical protein
MPLKKGSSRKVISENIRELYKDNKKSGKAKGAGGKARNKSQILAIALSLSGKKNRSKKEMRKTLKELKGMKNSLVKNIALAKRMGTSKPKSKSTISLKEFAKLKTYKKKK